MEPVTVESVEQAIDAVRSHPAVHPVGGRTKPLLSKFPVPVVELDCRGLHGLLEYEPTEFTFTARAGTPLKNLDEELAAHGQYLPFDPPYTAEGATLGGAIASGLNGSSSLRFGGARDFILGIKFIDGQGNLVTSGGKVVKNAAGFDLPKFMVGSAGRFGLLTELTLKVFPRPPRHATLQFTGDLAMHLDRIRRLILTPLEVDAIDVADSVLVVRIGGSVPTIESARQRIENLWGVAADRFLTEDDDRQYWQEANRFAWHDPSTRTLFKVPCQLTEVDRLAQVADETNGVYRVSLAGQVIYLSVAGESCETLLQRLDQLGFPNLAFAGPAPRPHWDALPAPVKGTVWRSLKHALDPDDRFVSSSV